MVVFTSTRGEFTSSHAVDRGQALLLVVQRVLELGQQGIILLSHLVVHLEVLDAHVCKVADNVVVLRTHVLPLLGRIVRLTVLGADLGAGVSFKGQDLVV